MKKIILLTMLFVGALSHGKSGFYIDNNDNLIFKNSEECKKECYFLFSDFQNFETIQIVNNRDKAVAEMSYEAYQEVYDFTLSVKNQRPEGLFTEINHDIDFSQMRGGSSSVNVIGVKEIMATMHFIILTWQFFKVVGDLGCYFFDICLETASDVEVDKTEADSLIDKYEEEKDIINPFEVNDRINDKLEPSQKPDMPSPHEMNDRISRGV